MKDQECNGPGKEWQEARPEMHTGSNYVVLRPPTLPETTKTMNLVIVSSKLPKLKNLFLNAD